MSTYLEARGEGNNLLVDDNFFTYAFLEKMFVFIPRNGNSGFSRIEWEFESPFMPILAIDPLDHGVTYYILDLYQVAPTRYRVVLAADTSNGAGVFLYIYSRPNDANGNVGCQCYDANGHIVFNSNWKFMEVKYFYQQLEQDVQLNENGRRFVYAVSQPAMNGSVYAYQHELGLPDIGVVTQSFCTAVQRNAQGLKLIANALHSTTTFTDNWTCGGMTPDPTDWCVIGAIDSYNDSWGFIGSGVFVLDINTQ